MRNRELRWHLEGSGIRVQLATYHGQQARLATAVLAGNSDLLAAKQAKSGIGKQYARSAADGDVSEVEHRERAAQNVGPVREAIDSWLP